TYLALTFGTLLSSQGTDAPFVLTLSGFPPDVFVRYFVFPTLPDHFRAVSGVEFLSSGRWRALPFGVSTTLAAFLGDSKSSRWNEFRHAGIQIP
ncbi:hypothetical protein, partial [Streptomyces sp. NPDC058657]|uniref:hypothetical protein n=1 Tax=unclassified Streptomyces TaxID=2593676 RepID=UPI003669CA14